MPEERGMEMDEYIKKETAYRAIMGERPEAREPSWFAELVLEIPAADVAPVRHGRWLVDGYVCGETEYQCSVCKETEWRTSSSRLAYCPFCGAKMDLEV